MKNKMTFDKLSKQEPRDFCMNYGFVIDIVRESKLPEYGDEEFEIIKVIDDISICVSFIKGKGELSAYRFRMTGNSPFHQVIEYVNPIPYIKDFEHELIGLRKENDIWN